MTTLTPRHLLLGLLRVAPGPLPVRDLVAVGQLFGFEQNAIRVALARLVQRGVLDNDNGVYGPTASAKHVGRWVETWREGDRRLRPWKYEWLCVLQPGGVARTPQRRSARALERFGFRPGAPRLWVRPNNLRADRDGIELELVQLGLAEGAEVFVGRDFSPGLIEHWKRELWDADQLRRDLRASSVAIERSRETLDTMPTLMALVESFSIGNRALEQLVRDPLLPDEICNGAERRALTRALQDYDRIGKALWTSGLVTVALAQKANHPSKDDLQ